jgi:hypothetical protein
MPKVKQNTQEPEEENNNTNSILVGFVRKTNAGKALKLSINTSSFADCATYVTSDGQTYVQLIVSLNSISNVIEGNRAVTAINHLLD